jgi:hypothetical protein
MNHGRNTGVVPAMVAPGHFRPQALVMSPSGASQTLARVRTRPGLNRPFRGQVPCVPLSEEDQWQASSRHFAGRRLLAIRQNSRTSDL